MEPLVVDHKLLLEALRFYRENFISSAYSTMGFTVVAIGWLVTSKSAQDFIRPRRWLGLASIIMIAASYAGYWRMALAVQSSSHAIATELSKHYQQIVYGHYELSLQGVYGFILIQGLATAFIILLIVSIINEPITEETTDKVESKGKRKKSVKSK